jgi:hypothetical protein
LAPQVLASVKALHGSAGPPPIELLFMVPVGAGTGPVEPQPQSHGGQFWPGAQSGHAHTQVPPVTQPVPPPQSQAQGGQASPGAQGAQAQVQLPPPLPPPLQSHSGGGHA